MISPRSDIKSLSTDLILEDLKPILLKMAIKNPLNFDFINESEKVKKQIKEMRDGGHMTKLDEIDWNIDVVRA